MELLKQELNGFGSRVAEVEKCQAAHCSDIKHNTKSIEEIWGAIDKMRDDMTGIITKLSIIIGVGLSANFLLMAVSMFLNLYHR